MRVKRRRRYKDVGVILRLLERRIPRRDPAVVRQAVRKILKGEDIHDVFHRSRARVLRPLAVVAVVVILAVGAWWFYQQGYWYELFQADRYGALVVSAQIDSAYKEPDEVFFRPALYREQGNHLTRVTGVQFDIHESASGRDRSELSPVHEKAVPRSRQVPAEGRAGRTALLGLFHAEPPAPFSASPWRPPRGFASR